MSRRLAVVNALCRALARRRLERVATPAQVRRDFALFAALLFRSPPGTRVAPLRAPPPCPPLVRVVCGAADARRTVLWIHGGGFISGSPRTHRGLAAWLARLSGLAVVLPDYRLAPEHPFPAPQEDCAAAWNALRAQGLAPGEIALGGDSAGGCLALGLMAALGRRGETPAAAVLFSPLTDFTGSGGSMRENAARDRLLPAGRLGELRDLVLGGLAPDDPRASPLFETFHSPPPVLFQVSQTEILRDDSLRMAERLRASGGAAQVELWPDAPHVWQALGGALPESRAALAAAAAFLRRAFSLPARSTGGS
ncbi:MAG: alpha/beta hydrolase [Rhodobacteraceae bacterium]|nr:alpha/beta hydrolase [Paracoccaceae bacterium]